MPAKLKVKVESALKKAKITPKSAVELQASIPKEEMDRLAKLYKIESMIAVGLPAEHIAERMGVPVCEVNNRITGKIHPNEPTRQQLELLFASCEVDEDVVQALEDELDEAVRQVSSKATVAVD